MKINPKQLFSEPSGWDTAKISIGGSLALFSLYVFFELRYASGLTATFIIGAAAGLSGIAELLPKNRRLLAGVLRVIALGVLVTLVVLSLRDLLS